MVHAFSVHSLQVAGGTLAIAPMPGRGGDYADDWARLLAWGPDIVVSMTPQAELARNGAATLPADLKQAHIPWLHLPTQDYGVAAESDWPDCRDRLVPVLQGQGRVIVHCLGGCGRSGMVALRVMIAAGEPAQAALARLRRVRACAVETQAQLDWARQG